MPAPTLTISRPEFSRRHQSTSAGPTTEPGSPCSSSRGAGQDLLDEEALLEHQLLADARRVQPGEQPSRSRTHVLKTSERVQMSLAVSDPPYHVWPARCDPSTGTSPNDIPGGGQAASAVTPAPCRPRPEYGAPPACKFG